MIEAHDLHKYFGTFHAVRGISLRRELPQGHCTVEQPRIARGSDRRAARSGDRSRDVLTDGRATRPAVEPGVDAGPRWGQHVSDVGVPCSCRAAADRENIVMGPHISIPHPDRHDTRWSASDRAARAR